MRMPRSAGVVVEGHPRVGGEPQVVVDASGDAAGEARCRRPSTPGGLASAVAPISAAETISRRCAASVSGSGVGESTGGGDRLERQQFVDDLGRPAPAGRHVHAGPQVGGVMVDHGDELAQQMGVA
jgi:hypothetical protein